MSLPTNNRPQTAFFNSERPVSDPVPLTIRRHLITAPAHSWMSPASPSGEDQEQSLPDRGERGSAGRDATDRENLTAQAALRLRDGREPVDNPTAPRKSSNLNALVSFPSLISQPGSDRS